eukprot:708313_1
MGTSCLSTVPPERESINIQPHQSIEKEEHSYESKDYHSENIHSSNNMNKHEQTTINPYENNPQNILTGATLHQHNRNRSMSTDLTSLSSTTYDDDILKHVGDQLLSMNIKNTNAEMHPEFEEKTNDYYDIDEINNNIENQVNANQKYKKYNYRQDYNKCTVANPFCTPQNSNFHSRNLPINASETSIPNDYKMELYNDNPKYYKLSSSSHYIRHGDIAHCKNKSVDFPDVYVFN